MVQTRTTRLLYHAWKAHVIDADVVDDDDVDDDDLFRVMTINTTVTLMIMMMMALVSVAIWNIKSCNVYLSI